MTTRDYDHVVSFIKPFVEPAPVRIVTCPFCGGDGWRETGSLRDDLTADGHRCTQCAGSGRIATDGGPV